MLLVSGCATAPTEGSPQVNPVPKPASESEIIAIAFSKIWDHQPVTATGALTDPWACRGPNGITGWASMASPGCRAAIADLCAHAANASENPQLGIPLAAAEDTRDASIYRVSAVGISPDGNTAAVELGHECGGMCGEGKLACAARTGGDWVVTEILPLWKT